MRSTFKRAVVFAPLALIGIVTACTTTARDERASVGTTQSAVTAPGKLHGVYWARGSVGARVATPPSPQACATPGLQYNITNSPDQVISNVEVVQVNWGPKVDPKITQLFESWYPAVAPSAYLSWLKEYDTVGLTGGTNQHIGVGTYKKSASGGGSFTITPANTATSVSNDDIGTEIIAQIKAGKLPAPTKDSAGHTNTIYMVDFPPGMIQTLSAGGQMATSCVDFCGYHESIVDSSTGTTLYFGVHPDMGAGSGCEASNGQWRCGGDTDELIASAVVHGHELIEAVTDPDNNGAWLDPQCGEIGDICANEVGSCGDASCQSPSVGSLTIGGTKYYMQTEWSNAQKDCVVQGKAVTCSTNTDCNATPSTPICDTGTKTCRACVANDCTGATPACETTGSLAGQCVQCTGSNSAACTGTTPLCDSSTDKCRGCVASDCTGTSKPVCEMTGTKQGTCVQCDGTNKAACTGTTPVCDTTTFTCVGCASNTDCMGGTPICDTGTKTCRACSGNTDCSGGKVCDTGTGANAGQCVGCVSNGDCANPTPTCNTTTNTCGACKTNGDCPNGQTCDTGSGSCMSGTTGGDGGTTTGGDGGTTTGGDGGTTTGGDGGSTTHHDGGSGSGSDSGTSGNGNGNGDNGGTTTTTAGCSVSTTGSSSGAAGGFAGLLLGLGFIARKRSKK